jgi:hypothetical protein
MQPNGIVADHATISSMLGAFDVAQSDCKSIQGIVAEARGLLAGSWQSDEAAKKFMHAIEMWVNGFQKVQQGLDSLNGNMAEYRNLTDVTEESTSMTAGGWAVA